MSDHSVLPPRRHSSRSYALSAAILIALLVLPCFVKSTSHQNVLILILLAAQLGVSWNILGGYAGQISLGHVAFFGLGAYTSSVLYIHYNVSPWIGAVAGGVLAALVSIVVGWSCFRLKGHYFAMATIAVAEIVQVIFANWDFVGASVGLTIPMDQTGLSRMIFDGKLPYYYLAFGLLALTLLANFAIDRSYVGFYLRAIKDEPDAARSLGVNLARYKQFALMVSSFLTALGGTLYAQKELYIDPASVLNTSLSIKMALVAILGGAGTLFGPVLGAVVLTLIEEATRIGFGGSGRGTDLIVYALLIIGIAVYYPRGILGWFAERRERKRGVAALLLAMHAKLRRNHELPLLAVEHLIKRFGGLVATDDVSFKLEAGEIVGLIGPNGAGKTTLFNCIAGYFAPSAGSILLSGQSIAGLAPEACARLGVARTFQIARTFHSMTALENVMVGAFLKSRDVAAARIKSQALLAFVDLAEHADRPSGTMTISEQRRLAVARALALDPVLLLMDEVMAGLNPSEVKEAVDVVLKIQAKGIACLIVEHVLEGIMPIAHRIVVLDGGKKIADDTPQKVSNDPAVIAAYLGS